jgi:hypothetical protein
MEEEHRLDLHETLKFNYDIYRENWQGRKWVEMAPVSVK